MADTVKRKNPLKTMQIVTMVLVIALIVVVLFVKQKVYMEDEQGQMYTGQSGRIGVKPKTDEA